MALWGDTPGTGNLLASEAELPPWVADWGTRAGGGLPPGPSASSREDWLSLNKGTAPESLHVRHLVGDAKTKPLGLSLKSSPVPPRTQEVTGAPLSPTEQAASSEKGLAPSFEERDDCPACPGALSPVRSRDLAGRERLLSSAVLNFSLKTLDSTY